MTTYTVTSKKPVHDRQSKPGLSLQEAVGELLDRVGFMWRFGRLEDGAMHLVLGEPETEYFFAPDEFVSAEPDDRKAEEEVMRMIVEHSQVDGGPYMILAER